MKASTRKLIREVHDSFIVDAFIGNAADWERVCMGNLVGMPVIVVPAGFSKISNHIVSVLFPSGSDTSFF